MTGPDGNLYAIGGSGVSGVLDTVQAYNPATNTWNTQTTPMPQPRSVLGVAVGTDGRIYAVNGANAYGNLTLVEALTLHPTVVADAPLTSSGTSFTTLQGESYTGVVASFTDADPNGTASDYSATIDWGTGQTSTGVITPNGSGGFNVTGTNIYSVSGTDAITVTISDVGGSSTVATSSATVTPTSIGIIHTLAGGGFALDLGGTGAALYARAVATDASGNVYTTGQFQGMVGFNGVLSLTSTGGADNAFVAKYSGNGQLLWAVNLGSGSNAAGYGIAVDGAGNVFTTGYFQGTGDFSGNGSSDDLTTGSANVNAYVSKLDASGNFVWARGLGTGSSIVEGIGIAVDGAGNIYTNRIISGHRLLFRYRQRRHADRPDFSGVNDNAYVSKLDASGNFAWPKRLVVVASDAEGYGIAVDGSGNVYTTGYVTGTGSFSGTGSGDDLAAASGNPSRYVSKLDTTGAFRGQTYLAAAAATRLVKALRWTARECLHDRSVCWDWLLFRHGQSATSSRAGSGSRNAYVSKLNADGTFGWADDLASGSNDAIGFGIAVDGVGQRLHHRVLPGHRFLLRHRQRRHSHVFRQQQCLCLQAGRRRHLRLGRHRWQRQQRRCRERHRGGSIGECRYRRLFPGRRHLFRHGQRECDEYVDGSWSDGWLCRSVVTAHVRWFREHRSGVEPHRRGGGQQRQYLLRGRRQS